MEHLYVDIVPPQGKVYQNFFHSLDLLFEQANYSLASCQIWTRREWSEVQCDQRQALLSTEKQFLVNYRHTFSDSDRDAIAVEVQVRESHIILVTVHTSYHFAFRSVFLHDEKAKALALQELCLNLHNAFDASVTEAWTMSKQGDDEQPWFRFSKDEWKPLGDLPVQEKL